MKKYFFTAATVAAVLSLSSTAAFSQTATSNMGVSMTVAAECTLSADALAFGSVGLINADVDKGGNITVKCTKGAVYAVSLGAGSGVGATVATRYMTNTTDTTQKAAYTIYSDSNHSVVWGDTVGTNTVSSGTNGATGDNETIPFYGRLIAGQSVAAGDYSDTVIATITYGTSL